MGLIRTFIAILSILAMPASASAASEPQGAVRPSREDARLLKIFSDDARRMSQIDPLGALYRGAPVDPQALSQLYTDAFDRRQKDAAQAGLRALRGIDRSRLSAERRISLDVFQAGKQEQLRWLEPDLLPLTAVRPFNHFGGLHIEFPALVATGGALPYETEEDYRRSLGLSIAFAVVLDNAAGRFRQGVAGGVVESRLTVANMISQIDALQAQPLEQSPFYSPVLDFPDSIPAARRAALRQAFAAAIRDRIRPAYARLRRFLADEYLPATSENPGLSAMPGGAFLYRRLIERETTLKLDPEDVHRLGLSEVARIQKLMEEVKTRLGFSGSLRAFFDAIRIDPRFHPRTREELARGFAEVGRKVDAQAPRYFKRMPRARLLIQPYPAYREKYEAGGSYNQGSADGTRPGIFFYNAYDLPSRFLSGITTLYLHEGAPGHHFQISLALEDATLPAFQRFDGNTAYVEGWALYAETLGYEMGLYDDPMQHWGTLDDEMLRAMRLVVDTGIHAKGWSRDQAIGYMLANSGMGRSDAEAEVDRYIATPAQALAYKIGALAIQRLRRKAEDALGPRFDIREFHDQVLSSGALPLPVLETKIERWISVTRSLN